MGSINFSSFHFQRAEPSMIYPSSLISYISDFDTVESPSYSPEYRSLSPEQRYVYWKFLSDPYNPSFNIGYIFLLYYGLERHMLDGNYVDSFHVILNLRKAHMNKSFQKYSGNALMFTSLFMNRSDLATEFIQSLDCFEKCYFSIDLFLLFSSLHNIPLPSIVLSSYAKLISESSAKYSREYPDAYKVLLENVLLERLSNGELFVRDYINDSDISEMPKFNVMIYANLSIRPQYIAIPEISSNAKLRNAVMEIIKDVNKRFKVMAKDPNAKYKIGEKVKYKTTARLLSFDKRLESKLLREYRKTGDDNFSRHFSLLQLQDFYYKYRSIEGAYLEKCIEFCNEDLGLLGSIKYEYLSDSIYTNGKKSNDKKYGRNLFKGDIPTFNRLFRIYADKGNTISAKRICIKAIKYYNGQKMEEESDYFNKKLRKLMEE
jgi:hypothetical protein